MAKAEKHLYLVTAQCAKLQPRNPCCVKQLSVGRKNGSGTCLNQSPTTKLGGALSEVGGNPAHRGVITARVMHRQVHLVEAPLDVSQQAVNALKAVANAFELHHIIFSAMRVGGALALPRGQTPHVWFPPGGRTQ
jgi:hypothetical protein